MATQRRRTVRNGKAARPAKVAKARPVAGSQKLAAPGTAKVEGPGEPTLVENAFRSATLKVVDSAVFTAGTKGRAPSRREVSEAAKAIRAQKELLAQYELRVIYQAARSKTSQAEVAALLGTSQPTISRSFTRIEEDPSILEPSPSEAINRHATGQISRETMMKTLLGFSYTPGRYDPTGGDGFLRGNWRQIEDALTAGYITDEEYERIAREAPAEKPTRATQ